MQLKDIKYFYFIGRMSLVKLSKKSAFNALLKIIEILIFAFVIASFIGNYYQSKLLKTQIFASNAVSFLQLADQSMWYNHGGNRSSYSILEGLREKVGEKELKDAIASQVKSIKDSYDGEAAKRYVENLGVICKQGTYDPETRTCDFVTKTKFDATHVFSHLENHSTSWAERAKAAYFLREIECAIDVAVFNESNKKTKLYETLIYFMQREYEPSLLVSKMALDAYAKLARFETRKGDVFAFDGATEHWLQNKEAILKKPFVGKECEVEKPTIKLPCLKHSLFVEDTSGTQEIPADDPNCK